MSYAEPDYGRSLAIGTVLGRAFGVMSGNPVTVFGIAFLFGALPQVLVEAFGAFTTGASVDARMGQIFLSILYLVVFILCSCLAQAALVRAAGAYLDGRVASIGECIATGIANALPVVGVSILFILGFMTGLFLFFIPGIMLLVRWAVILPALVEDNTGVTEAFGRSSYLTKGSRWQILFVMFVTLVINWLFALIALVPALMMGVSQTATPTAATIVLSLVSSTLSTALWATVLTSLYFALRERIEGPQTEKLANVFA